MLVLCAAVGFGANVIVLGVSDQLIFGAPPGVRSATALVRLGAVERTPGSEPREAIRFSHPMVRLIDEPGTLASSIAAYSTAFVDVETSGAVRREIVTVVSDRYFETLGVGATVGALPDPSRPGDWSADGVVVSERVAARLGGSVAEAVGRTIRLSDRPFTIIAVTAGAFSGIDVERSDLWIPLDAWATQLAGANWRTDRSAFWLSAIARLRRGASGAQLEAQLTTRVRGSAMVRASDEFAIRTEPLTTAQGSAQRRLRLLAVVLSAVSVLILIASAVNIASVLLGRVIERDREFALRLALGASRRSMLGIVAAEGAPILLLALAAGAGGAVLASRSISELVLPGIAWPDRLLSGRVIVVAGALFALALAVTVVVPAWQAQRTRLAAVIASEGAGTTRRSSRLWSLMLSAQFACTVVLLFGAITFSSLLARLEGTDLGFDVRHAGVIDFAATGRADTAVVSSETLAGLVPRIALLPGVRAVGLGADVPLRRSTGTMMEVMGVGPVEPLETGGPYLNALDAQAVVALGLVLRRGRLVEEGDRLGALPVMLVTETFERRAFRGKDALGGCVRTLFDVACRTVVGVVQDVRRENVLEPATLQVFIPIMQASRGLPPQAIFVRTAEDPSALRSLIRDELARAGITPTSYQFDAFASLVEPELTVWRVAASVFVIYAVFALIVAMTGTLGMLTLDVARRRREFAIRVVLGARFYHVLSQVIASIAWWVVLGAVVGLAVWAVAWRQLDLLVADLPRLAVGSSALQTVAILVGAAGVIAFVTALRAWRVSIAAAVRE